MSVIPENERIVRVDESDEEGWVDTHHGIGEPPHSRISGAVRGAGGHGLACTVP